MSESPLAESTGTVGGVADDVPCPICGYNLRGIGDPRCPECGMAFTWEDIRDPRRRLHPYLFEHHPERNAWSLWRTLRGGLWPWRFWTRLHPLQGVNRGRLVLYWKTSVTAFAATLLLFLVMMLVAFDVQRTELRGQMAAMIRKDLQIKGTAQWAKRILEDHGSIENYLDAYFPSALGRRYGHCAWNCFGLAPLQFRLWCGPGCRI